MKSGILIQAAVIWVGLLTQAGWGQVFIPMPLPTTSIDQSDEISSSSFVDDPMTARYWVVSGVPGQRLDLAVDRWMLEPDFDPFVWVFAGRITNINYFAGGATPAIDQLDPGFLAIADDGVGPFGFNQTQDPRLSIVLPPGISECTVIVTSFISGIVVNGVYSPNDGGDGRYRYFIRASLQTLAPPSVRGRHVFDNNSAWDNNEVAATATDDAAVAPNSNKWAYLPGTGQAASYGNYTNYSRGLNGIMIDVVNLPGTPTAADFEFRIGNNNAPATWASLPSFSVASVLIRRGAGVDGSDRVTIIFADNAIRNQWLQVRMLNTAQTGVGDVHYWGHQTGETGSPNAAGTAAVVDITDVSDVRNHPRSGLSPAPIDFPYDLDRDRRVDISDVSIARNSPASGLTALRLVTIP